MTIPQELRRIAGEIDGAQHCARAAQLRVIARSLEDSCDDLLAQIPALDGVSLAGPLDRASIIGRAMGSIRSAASRIVGFERAHPEMKEAC